MTFGAASAIWAAIYGVAGAIIGSFVAALVLRWLDDRSVLAGRSACDHCGKTLRAWELVPVVSFVLLRGRCAWCRKAIDPVHWRIETIAALIGVSAGWVAGADGWTGALFGWTLLALGALDALAFWLPDRLTAWAAGAGVLTGLLGHAPSPDERIVGGLVGFVGLWAIAEGYRRWRGREGMGGGDPSCWARSGCGSAGGCCRACCWRRASSGWASSLCGICWGSGRADRTWCRWDCCSRWRLTRPGC